MVYGITGIIMFGQYFPYTQEIPAHIVYQRMSVFIPLSQQVLRYPYRGREGLVGSILGPMVVGLVSVV